ncbi:MAG: hypothetical protein ACRDHG_02015, partial [Anaerolineales bacterium]
MSDHEVVMRKFVEQARSGRLTSDLVEELRAFVRRDDPQGFRLYYELTRNRILPDHCYDEWIVPMYQDHADGMDSIFEAFRGSTKTTTIAETFQTYQIGLHADRSNLFIQADDTKARKHAKNAADLIAHNPMWKLLFPEIVPDEARGWGAEGYWVKDASVDYGNWVRSRDKDPTLVGAGIFDSFIVGMHPTGLLNLDDINNDRNTESEIENERVNRLLTDTIFPVSEDVAWHLLSQTPWTDRDALALAKATGVYRLHRTPVYRLASPEEPGAVFFEPREEWVRLTWPQKFTLARTENQFWKSGSVGFARMYLLDLEAVKGHNLKRQWIYYFPAEEIKLDEWPVFMGVDYASASDQLTRAQRRSRDFFVVCWGYLTPAGALVVVDGIREQVSQAEAEQRLIALASAFPRLMLIGLEAIGKGEEFAELVQRAGVFMPLMPIPGHAGLARSKAGRFEKVMAPMFQRREVMLSGKSTSFLQHFTDEWLSFDGRDRRGTTDDCLDGVYM